MSNMAFELDSRVAELLCARLCHDLIGPVAAINNGLELMTDFDDGMQGDAMALVGESAERAAKLLQFYRVAFGSARAPDGRAIGIGEARDRALDALASDRIAIDWPRPRDADDHGDEKSRLAVKLILNLVLLGTELLPGTGEVVVRVESGEATSMIVTAKKEGLTLETEFSEALDGSTPVDALTPRTVLAHLTRSLAESAGMRLRVECTPGQVAFNAEVPT